MKRAFYVILYIMLGLYIFFPLGSIVSGCFGYVFTLFNYTVFGFVSAAVSLAAAVIAVRSSGSARSKAEKAALILLPLLACVNWIFYLFKSSSVISVICMPFCLICALVIAAQAKPISLKLFAMIPSLLLTVPLSFITFIWLIFGQTGLNTVVSTLPSPDGTYYAEVIDSDQGALGGDTIVYVYDTRCIDAVIFSASRAPERVYLGPWRAWQHMSIYWEDDRRLVINAKEYLFD